MTIIEPGTDEYPSPRPFAILLVEDNPGDELLTRIALEEGHLLHDLRVVRDGVEAMELLNAGAYRPDLILLDLNLPRKDGREVLTELKAADALMNIPVIVLTTSSAESDVQRSYQLHANSYIVKPVDLAKFVEAVRVIETYWFALVRLPTGTIRMPR